MKSFQSGLWMLAASLALTAAHAVPTRLSADAGEVRDIKYASGAGAGAVMYAATQGGGVFKSTNAGLTWALTGLNSGYAWKLAVSPLNTSRVYAATDAGLFRTDNAGTTWTQLSFDPAQAVAVNPGSAGSDTVLLGVRGMGLLRSVDNGATFAMHSNGLDSNDITQIVYQASGIAYVVLECNIDDGVTPFGQGNWGGVFRSTNANAAAGAITWSSYQNGGGAGALPSKCIKALAASATTVYAGVHDPFGAGGRIYMTTGGAGGWTTGAAGSPATGDMFGVEALAVDRNAATTVHAGARAIGAWSSADSGTNYIQKVDPSPGLDPDVWTKIYAIESVPGLGTTVLVAAKGLGIMRTTNFTNAPASAITWNVAPGITADRVRALANHAVAAPNTYWMALENGGVVKSTNAGANWAQFISGFDFGGAPGCCDQLLSAQAIAADPNSTSVVLVGTRGGGLLNLNAGGTGWVNTGVPVSTRNNGSDFKPQALLMPAANQIYYTLFDGQNGGTAGGLLRSTTGPAGLTQTVFPGDLLTCVAPAFATGSAHKVVQTSGSRAYLLRYDALPFRSTDNFASNGATCVNAPSIGYERLAFYDLTENPSNTAILVAATSKGVYRSVDSGANWGRVTVTGLFTQVLSAISYVGTNLFAIERAGRLYCSSNNGDAWQSVSLGTLPAVPFRDMKVINGSIHVLTDGGGVYNGFAATCP